MLLNGRRPCLQSLRDHLLAADAASWALIRWTTHECTRNLGPCFVLQHADVVAAVYPAHPTRPSLPPSEPSRPGLQSSCRRCGYGHVCRGQHRPAVCWHHRDPGRACAASTSVSGAGSLRHRSPCCASHGLHTCCRKACRHCVLQTKEGGMTTQPARHAATADWSGAGADPGPVPATAAGLRALLLASSGARPSSQAPCSRWAEGAASACVSALCAVMAAHNGAMR
jgi:hypothetical protein